MSLAINPDEVVAVLLVDGWHRVEDDSFTLDAYEFIEPHPNPDRDGLMLHGGGQYGVCANGFCFREVIGRGEDREVVLTQGPLTAVLAVRERRRQGDE